MKPLPVILRFIPALMLVLTSCQIEKEPYNVLLIVADDMNGYGFLKSNPVVQTPHLDQFRESAVTFPHTYCAAPACSPSRTAFLTGLSPHHTGKYFNGCKEWDKPLLQEQETMPEWFRRTGYHAYGKGKLFHSTIPKDRLAKNFEGSTGQGGFGPFPDSAHQLLNRFMGIQAFPDSLFPDVHNADAVIDLLQSPHDAPFFIMYGLWRPHTPLTCPQRFFDLYDTAGIEIPAGYMEDDLEDLPPMARAYVLSAQQRENFEGITRTEAQWKAFLRGYFACYTFADYNIGRVLDALEKSPYAENTIVVVTSDNGFHMGEKRRFDKNSLWELSAITPMAIMVPGSGHSGTVCNSPVNLLDLYPTFVDYCGNGQGPLQPVDGLSIRPLLEDPEAEWERPSVTWFGKGWISLRSERFRYIRYPDGTEELYDHSADHWELENLAGDSGYGAVKEEFRAFIPDSMAEAIPGQWTTRMQLIEEKTR